MTRIKFIAFILFTTLITSCSSDNKNDATQSTQTTDPFFNFTYDKEVKPVNTWAATKQGDLIGVSGLAPDGSQIDFNFNVYGNLYSVSTHAITSTTASTYRESLADFSANTFTFTLENLNTMTKMVKVKFSGNVYIDTYNYQSNYVVISGEFNIPYTDAAPDIDGLGTYAKIDGKDWHGLSLSSSSQSNGGIATTTLNVANDGQYSIGIVYPQGNLKTGTFAFTDNTFSNKISFQKYDITTHAYITYDVTGTIIYTVVNDSYVSGTFSLTATNPVDKTKIVISNGTFTEAVN